MAMIYNRLATEIDGESKVSKNGIHGHTPRLLCAIFINYEISQLAEHFFLFKTTDLRQKNEFSLAFFLLFKKFHQKK